MEKMVMRDCDWNAIACNVGDIGVEHIDNLNGTAILHDEGSIPTFEATTSPNDAKTLGLKSIEDSAINSAEVPHKTFVKMHIFPNDISLVYYPIWVVRYKYNNRMYFCTIDGIVGKVLAGRAPGDTLLRNIAMSLGMLIGGYGSALGLLAFFYVQGNGSWVISVGIIAVCRLHRLHEL